MSLMNIAKKGWHPEKEGTTFKKQVVSLSPVENGAICGDPI